MLRVVLPAVDQVPDTSSSQQTATPQANTHGAAGREEVAQCPTKAKKTGKAKAKPPLATSKEGIDLEFARAEINTLKAKLRAQETDLKDIKFQNTILLDRISALEKPGNQALFDQYFPNRSQASHNSCCSHQISTCCQTTRFVPCETRVTPQNSSVVEAQLASIVTSLAELRQDITLLQNNIPNKTQQQEACPTSSSEQNVNQSEPLSPIIQNTSDETSGFDFDNSMQSLDEVMPSISDEEHLNCHSPTIQLPQLKQ